MRALEVCEATGRPYSSFRSGQPTARSFSVAYHYIDWPREALYERINRRVDLMFEQGLEGEARALYSLRHLSPLQTVGYQELFDHFESKHDLKTARVLICQHSRQYAKRQLTWLRRDGYWKAWTPAILASDEVDVQGFLPR
jgi:tRNA dimethylallyltransferase